MTFWFGLAACEDPVGVGVPWLEVAPVEITGELGVATTVAVQVTNSGTGPATAVATISGAPVFEAAGGSVVMAPGATEAVFVTFTPAGSDPVDAELVVDASTTRVEVLVRGVVDLDVDDDGVLTRLAGGADCDDHDPARFPGNPESCNAIDDDCNDLVDDVSEPPSWYADRDGDRFGDAADPQLQCFAPNGFVGDATDCDDRDASVFPGADDPFYDGVDANCDGASDYDQDLDGVLEASGGGLDCDDLDPTVNPTVAEVWYDGTDQDCDGNDDDQDLDGDPFPADCDDLVATVGPSAPELDDGLDQDCDGYRDEGLFAAGTLLIVELLENPARVADGLGRWVELTNPTDGDVDLAALTLVVGTDETPLPARWLLPGEVTVWCADADPLLNGGVSCDGAVAWTSSTPTSLEVRVTATGFVLDDLDLRLFSVSNGRSRELQDTAFDPVANNRNASWCFATTPFGDGDLGTPGSAVPSCP